MCSGVLQLGRMCNEKEDRKDGKRMRQQCQVTLLPSWAKGELGKLHYQSTNDMQNGVVGEVHSDPSSSLPFSASLQTPGGQCFKINQIT